MGSISPKSVKIPLCTSAHKSVTKQFRYKTRDDAHMTKATVKIFRLDIKESLNHEIQIPNRKLLETSDENANEKNLQL